MSLPPALQSEIYEFYNIRKLLILVAITLSLRATFVYVLSITAFKSAKTPRKSAAVLWLMCFKTFLAFMGLYGIAVSGVRETGELWYIPRYMWRRTPHLPFPGVMTVHVFANLCFFASETVASAFSLFRRADEPALLLHHLVTLGLLWEGLSTGIVRASVVILSVHELGMPFINWAKWKKTLGLEGTPFNLTVFGIGCLLVIGGRMIWFPTSLWSSFMEYEDYCEDLCDQSIMTFFHYFGGVLQCVHVFFTWVICRVWWHYYQRGEVVDEMDKGDVKRD